MKKYYKIIFALAIIVIAIIVGLIIKKEEVNYKANEDFIFITSNDSMGWNSNNKNEYYKSGHIFTSYSDFYSFFGNKNELDENDFVNNNYVLIIISGGCNSTKLYPTSYNWKGNTLNVKVKFISGCGNCEPTKSYYVLPIEKNKSYVNVKYNYKSYAGAEKCNEHY